MFLPVPGQDPELAEQLRHKVLRAISTRQLEFLLYICDPDEHSYKQIAFYMCVSENRVHEYRKELSAKFNVSTKSGLVIFAHDWQIDQLADRNLRAA